MDKTLPVVRTRSPTLTDSESPKITTPRSNNIAFTFLMPTFSKTLSKFLKLFFCKITSHFECSNSLPASSKDFWSRSIPISVPISPICLQISFECPALFIVASITVSPSLRLRKFITSFKRTGMCILQDSYFSQFLCHIVCLLFNSLFIFTPFLFIPNLNSALHSREHHFVFKKSEV